MAVKDLRDATPTKSSGAGGKSEASPKSRPSGKPK